MCHQWDNVNKVSFIINELALGVLKHFLPNLKTIMQPTHISLLWSFSDGRKGQWSGGGEPKVIKAEPKHNIQYNNQMILTNGHNQSTSPHAQTVNYILFWIRKQSKTGKFLNWMTNLNLCIMMDGHLIQANGIHFNLDANIFRFFGSNVQSTSVHLEREQDTQMINKHWQQQQQQKRTNKIKYWFAFYVHSFTLEEVRIMENKLMFNSSMASPYQCLDVIISDTSSLYVNCHWQCLI